ncbi:16S rRNA (cytosine(1402)-N(4))-methyltransferase RsmH [Cytophagaceae bacterium YF14B1]|uniref:Ribosomal RNA small subunit methyltransferase H n=1 Tax=Xanthocytophaga flava TaxID=3048013 RepID=A0AAE3QR76_9BACT|nr:16S rRNA (cytosine(1402)-N(4))-methyltransferase RsmH [Xanthocytophaga flavus]MDJ1481238.1 16S rRNA (cytosine(1402)-N(4))-methyltransferase RsmH [Xanthocytophaga flavus]
MYHIPVLLKECIDGLNIKPDGVYVDVTFGGGGHSRLITEHLTTGKLFSFDQDEDAVANAESITYPGFQLIKANFRHLRKFLKLYGAAKVDGILGDLGISSHQIDAPARGFSTRFPAQLDMRMDQTGDVSASDIVNSYSEEQLHKILGMYGEVKNARTLAAAITRNRFSKSIETTNDLISILQQYAPKGKEYKYYAQVFQALRIEVNQELAALEEMLSQSADVLKPGGRLVIMSYHSLEDRLVKNFIRTGKFSGDADKDLYGNTNVPFQVISKKPIEPDADEIARNPRARSAKLRIAERI